MPKKAAAPQPGITPPEPKCYITTGTLPPVEETSKRPYSALLTHPFNHKVDVTLPTEVYNLIKDKLSTQIEDVIYHRIFMPLGKILEKEFYDLYIRQGDILLLSSGNLATSDIFTLHGGVLQLSLAKQTYQKAGLVGRPARFGGANGRAKDRFIVEYDLLAPHMVHGKKAFKRLEWACEKVLNGNVAWVFCDLRQQTVACGDAPETRMEALPGLGVPTKALKARRVVAESGTALRIPDLLPLTVPEGLSFEPSGEYKKQCFLDWALSLHEWLALTTIPADRLRSTDIMDTLLSRYTVDKDHPSVQKITKVTWKGFLPAGWVNRLFLSLTKLVPVESWVALTMFGFADSPISWGKSQHGVGIGGMGGENLMTVMRLPKTVKEMKVELMDVDSYIEQSETTKGEFICWEITGGRDEHS